MDQEMADALQKIQRELAVIQEVKEDVAVIKQMVDDQRKWNTKRDRILFGEKGDNGLVGDVTRLKDRQSGILWGLRSFGALVLADLLFSFKIFFGQNQ